MWRFVSRDNSSQCDCLNKYEIEITQLKLEVRETESLEWKSENESNDDVREWISFYLKDIDTMIFCYEYSDW